MNQPEYAFQTVFGAAFATLPPVFKKRYGNRAYSHDVMTAEGKMEISYSRWMSLFMPIFRLLHVLVPYPGKDIPVRVAFRSDTHSNAIYFDRTFYFPGKKPYTFNSCMQPQKLNEVIEYMVLGMGWKTHYFYDGKKVMMQHKAYVLRIFGWNLPLPFWIFIGKGYAEEIMIDDNSWHVSMIMTHPLFGVMYRYSGNFSFVSTSE